MARSRDALDVHEHWPMLTPTERGALRPILYWDMTSEYDARFLDRHLRSLDADLSAAFFVEERRWLEDERRHHEVFRAVYERLFGDAREILAERRPNFAPLAHLFGDELAICCLFAYDELATVRGYRVNLPLYDRLGPRLGAFVRSVIAEEARHFGSFFSLILARHADRLDEAEAILARIRAAEGTPYASTFVLDHDEDLYTDAVLDQSARLLLRHIAGWSRRLAAVR